MATREEVHMCSLQWIDSFMEELVVESRSSGESSDAAVAEDLASVHPLDDERLATEGSKSTGEEKRRRHRESMARLRGARRSRIGSLELQEKSLHQQLRRVLAAFEVCEMPHDAVGCRCAEYIKLVQATEQLLQEQYALENQLHLRVRYARLVASECVRMEDSRPPDRPSLPGSDGAEPHGFWLRYQENELPVFYELESVESCAATTERYAHVMEETRTLLSSASDAKQSARCLGWHAERHIEASDPPLLRFRFSKRVLRSHATPADLESGTWAMLQSPERMARVYGSAVLTKTVQSVSDDAFVLLRNSPVRTRHRRFRYFNLNSRLRTSDGRSVTILMMILDKEPPSSAATEHERNEEEHDRVRWLKHGAGCLRFTRTDDGEAVDVEYTGVIQCVSDDHAAHLLMESCASLLRWEHLVAPPQLLLAA